VRVGGRLFPGHLPYPRLPPGKLVRGDARAILRFVTTSPPPRRFAGWPYAALVGIVIVVFLPGFLGQVVFMRDPAHWTFPMRTLVRQALLEGRLPSWDPTQALGFPLLADPLVGLLYPPNFLYLLPNTAWMVTLDSLLHVLIGALGVVALLRRLRVAGVAALVGGIAWALSGITVGMWTAGLLLQAMAWMPWAGFAGHRLGQLARDGVPWRQALRPVALAALPTALGLLQGEIFVATMGVVFALAFALFVVVKGGADGGGDGGPKATEENAAPLSPLLLRLLAFGGMAVVLAGALGAVNVLPARASAARTERSSPLPRPLAEVWSFAPLRLVEMTAPGAMGHPLRGYPGGPFVGDPTLGGETLTFSVYLGASVLALALLALGRGRPLAWFLAAVAVAALVIAMGRHLPVHRFTRWLVPPLMYMRYPEKYLVIVAAVVPLLAGLGVDRLLADSRRLWRRWLIFAGVLLAFAVFVVVFPEPLRPLIRPASLYGAAAVTLLILLATARKLLRRQLGLAVLVAVVTLDLAFPVFDLIDFVDADLATRVPPAASHVIQHRASVALPRIYRYPTVATPVADLVPARDAAQYESRNLLTLVPNAANVHGLASLPGYDAAIPSAWERLFEAGMTLDPVGLFRLTSTEFVVGPTAGPHSVRRLRGLVPSGLDPLPGSRLFAVEQSLPRIFAVGRTEAYEARIDEPAAANPQRRYAGFSRLFAPEILAGQVALVAPNDPHAQLTGAAGRAGTCSIDRYRADEISARCTLQEPAVVVFVEQHDSRGWSATIDGVAAPLFVVNHVMRGLRAEAGDHRIELAYRAPGRTASAVVSLLALVALLLMVGLRRRPTPTPAL
jgi:hypothetical protein